MSKPIKHILVIRLSAMGDVAMTVPVIRQLVKQYPHVRITILTRGLFKPFFRDLDNVSVYEIDVKGKHKGVFGLYKLSRELKALNFDAIVDLHNVLRSNVLKIFLKGKIFLQVDKGRGEKKVLISGKIFEQLKTTHQRYADVFEGLGYKLNLSNPSFPNPTKVSEKVIKMIGKDPTTWVGIAPFAAFKSKTYPLELMGRVIEELSKSYKVLLFGGGQTEIEALNKIKDKYQNTVNLVGKLSLDEELDIISNLEVMVSMDSGNAHIGAMLGTEVITLWGVTHPYAGFYPFNQNIDNALLTNREQYPKIPTSVYGNKFPDGYEGAIGSISPQDIIDKVNVVVRNKKSLT